MVSIAGDAPSGVVVGVGAILGGVRDVLEACDGTGSRGCSDTAFSREEADKKRNSAERKARDARRAGRILSESGQKMFRKSAIQRMLAGSRATPRVHAPDEGRSEDAQRDQKYLRQHPDDLEDLADYSPQSPTFWTWSSKPMLVCGEQLCVGVKRDGSGCLRVAVGAAVSVGK